MMDERETREVFNVYDQIAGAIAEAFSSQEIIDTWRRVDCDVFFTGVTNALANYLASVVVDGQKYGGMKASSVEKVRLEILSVVTKHMRSRDERIKHPDWKTRN